MFLSRADVGLKCPSDEVDDQNVPVEVPVEVQHVDTFLELLILFSIYVNRIILEFKILSLYIIKSDI